MKKVLLKIWSILKNYYILATVFFIVWVGFIDTDNLVGQYAQRREMNDLIRQKQFYSEEISRMKKLSEALKTDREAIERYGRENYQMKKQSEDIFIIVSNDSVAKKQ